MVTFRKSLIGYSRKEVDREFSHLEEQLSQHQKEVKEHQELIDELKRSVKRYQEREAFISDIMIDTQEYSKTHIEDSRANAKKISDGIIAEAQQRMDRAEETIAKVKNLEETYAQYEHTLKRELRSVLEDYLELVDRITLTQTKQQEAILDQEVEAVKDDVALTRNIINFRAKNNDSDKGDVPVYVME